MLARMKTVPALLLVGLTACAGAAAAQAPRPTPHAPTAASLAHAPAPPPDPLVDSLNLSFEHGTDGWHTQAYLAESAPVAAHSGKQGLRLGGDAASGPSFGV